MSAIDAAIRQFDLRLSPVAREQLDGYVALLMDANSQFNLTALKDPDAIESRLIAGSLEILPFIPEDAGALLDIGSGGGIPGMVLAIARPELDVTLLDATSKKVTFLNETAAVLGLENLRALHGRSEDLARDPSYRERFPVVTARAVARLATLVELVLPFVTPGGMAILPKGPGAAEELEEARPAIGFVGGKRPRIEPSQLDDSLFVLIDKGKPTPERFPRRVGIPGKRPIGVPAG